MIKAIFAVDYWGGMGFSGSLPWPHHREDLQYFKEQTDNNVVVMGRRTWDDPKMPKPLPNRTHVIITRQKNYHPEGCIVVDSIEKVETSPDHFKDNEIEPNFRRNATAQSKSGQCG